MQYNNILVARLNMPFNWDKITKEVSFSGETIESHEL